MPAYPLRCTHSLAACLALLCAPQAALAQPSPAPAAAPDPQPGSAAPEGQVQSGFALQTSLVATPIVISGGGGLPGFFAGLDTFEGGLFGGYKFDRIIVGAGFDFTHYGESETVSTIDPNTMQDIEYDETRRTFSFVVYPEVQVAFLRSADLRAELFGAASVGFGTWDTVITRDPDPNPAPSSSANEPLRLRVRWRVGPGVRYWVHPHIAMALVTGVAGNHMIIDAPTPVASSATGLIALYTQLGLTGVF